MSVNVIYAAVPLQAPGRGRRRRQPLRHCYLTRDPHESGRDEAQPQLPQVPGEGLEAKVEARPGQVQGDPASWGTTSATWPGRLQLSPHRESTHIDHLPCNH